GGSLTPLGDPPLFLGFLRGVDFFWTTTHMLPSALFVGGIVLAIFFVLDTILFRREEDYIRTAPDPTPDSPVRLRGLVNLPLLAGVIAAILMSGMWSPGISFHVYGVELELQNLLRDAIILVLALISLAVSAQ